MLVYFSRLKEIIIVNELIIIISQASSLFKTKQLKSILPITVHVYKSKILIDFLGFEKIIQ